MDYIEEAHSVEFGRHLLAAQDLQPGTNVLTQQPYAAVLYDDQVNLRCDYCFRASTALMRCARSKFAHYCCQAHQKAAWRAYYRQECNSLVAIAPRVPPASVRLAARVLWRRTKELSTAQEQQQQQQLAAGCYADVQQLQSHWEELDAARKVMYAQMAVLTRQFMLGDSSSSSSSGQQPPDDSTQQQQQQQQQQEDAAVHDVKHIAQLLARFACNNHTICDEELRPIGVGLYPLGALINHSCRPNCAQSFQGPAIVFRSLCSIPAGQQLTISYVELAATRQERKRQLLQQYFFDIDAAAAAAAATPAPAAGGKAAQALPIIAEEAGTALSGAADVQHQPGSNGLQQQLQQPPPLRMQVQVQLPQAVIAAQQQLARHTASSSASSASNSSSSIVAATLLSSTTCSSAPWPADQPDRQLCQLLLQLNPSSPPNNSSSSSQQQLVKLPGSMCLFADQAACESDDDAAVAAAAAAAAGLFKDLEGLEVSAGADVAEGTSTLDGDVQQSQEQQQQQQQQQVQQLEVVQWGDWAKAAAAAADGLCLGSGKSTTSSGSTDSLPDALVVRAAHLLLHVWALRQQAEQLTSNGYPAAAMQLYQQALAAADGATTVTATPPSSSLPSEHAFAAGASSSSSSGSTLVLGPKHILRTRVNAGLLKAAVDEGSSWGVALAAAQALTPVYELVYPKVWPNLGLHHALTAKLAMLLQQPAAAAAAASAAASVLQVTHPGSSPVLAEVMQLRYEAQQELAAMQRMCQG